MASHPSTQPSISSGVPAPGLGLGTGPWPAWPHGGGGSALPRQWVLQWDGARRGFLVKQKRSEPQDAPQAPDPNLEEPPEGKAWMRAGCVLWSHHTNHCTTLGVQGRRQQARCSPSAAPAAAEPISEHL